MSTFVTAVTVMAVTLILRAIKFYNREAEMAAMRKFEKLSAQSAQMIVVTGRRRIGKTTLIKRAFTSLPLVYFFVGKKSEALLCEELVEIVKDVLGEDLGNFTSFKRLFSAIMSISKRRNFTLVFDEFQNFKEANSGIFSDIQDVWDSNKEDSRINLVICGSVYSKMKKIFDDKDEPLFGRATARFRIKPFTTETLKTILQDHYPDYEADDLLALYMVTGGSQNMWSCSYRRTPSRATKFLTRSSLPAPTSLRRGGKCCPMNSERITGTIFPSCQRWPEDTRHVEISPDMSDSRQEGISTNLRQTTASSPKSDHISREKRQET